MLTPAQRHFQKVMAERRGISDERDAETRTAHEQILFRLHMHKSSLSQIQSRRAKAAVKASILPEFQGWIDGTIEGDSGRADPVITTLMVWAVDCSDYALALRIGRYVVKHGLSMPDDNYRRPAPTLLAEEICNPILNLATTDAGADLSGYIPMLDELAEIVADSDMPDEVRAKLCKVRAFCRRDTEDAETKGEALKLFREAMSLNPGAGVKREIASLVSALKRRRRPARQVVMRKMRLHPAIQQQPKHPQQKKQHERASRRKRRPALKKPPAKRRQKDNENRHKVNA